MKKNRSRQSQASAPKEEKMTLSSMLDQDLVNQLKNKQRELMDEELKKKEAAEQKRKEERRKAEKNKSFAELLSEDKQDWHNFK
ncbi:YqkE family protein [Bacillus sp. 1P06AnD]|uniref:YqkE family protein n=1 Tax=Bacillus sp. 1P06AnD TaxID=3132208 RepID=UPI0039A3479A